MAKEFFDANNIQYTDHNVAEDNTKREEMVEMTGQMGVPVIKIDEETMVGFNEPKLKELLADDLGGDKAAPEAEVEKTDATPEAPAE
jgi:glutaredoxin 3